MKVLFFFGALTHYNISILNRLNSRKNSAITVVIPNKDSSSVGAGVYQTQMGAEFNIVAVNEYQTYYHKPFFSDIRGLLNKEKPDIIVAGWPYILGLFFNPLVFIYIKRKKIRIILRDIPFQLPKYKDTIDFYKNRGFFIEDKGYTRENSNKNSFVKYRLLAILRKIYFNLADAHVYYVEDVFDIIGSYGVPREKIFIIYNSPDTDKLLAVFDKIKSEKPILPQNNFRLIHVGRLVKWKKVDLLINAFKVIRQKYPEAELIIVGKGPEESNLKNQAADPDLENSIKFVGSIYDPEVLGQYLYSSTIYILAGMGGLSINEAMCFGKPVICSICDGTEKKLVYDGVNGLYFKMDDQDDLVNKIDYLLANPELISKMGLNSIKIIKEEINIHTVIRGYLKAFEYVLQTKNKHQNNPNV